MEVHQIRDNWYGVHQLLHMFHFTPSIASWNHGCWRGVLQLLPRHDSMAMQRHFDAHGILRIQMTKQWVWGTKLLHLCS